MKQALGNVAKPVLALAALAAFLAACSDRRDRGICPRVAVLAEAGTLTRFRPDAPQTPENVMFTARMTDVRIECRYQDVQLSRLEGDVTVTMEVTRGPAMQGEAATFPYFVGVANTRGAVLNKRIFDMRVPLSGQTTRASDQSWQFYRLSSSGSGLLYETWVGFQLTDAELAYNRRVGATR
jgi:hypothetical protein